MELIILLVASITIIVLVVIITNFKRVKITNIKSFHFSYSTGNGMNSNVILELSHNDNNYIAKIKPDSEAHEHARCVEVGEEFINKFVSLLKRYRVERWNGFRKSDNHIFDGNCFNMSLYNQDGTSISASGYMKWPNNYFKVRDELTSMFYDLAEKN